jgi:hypothetical protein
MTGLKSQLGGSATFHIGLGYTVLERALCILEGVKHGFYIEHLLSDITWTIRGSELYFDGIIYKTYFTVWVWTHDTVWTTLPRNTELWD